MNVRSEEMDETVREPSVGTAPMSLNDARVALNVPHRKTDEPPWATVIGCAETQHDGCGYTIGAGWRGGAG